MQRRPLARGGNSHDRSTSRPLSPANNRRRGRGGDTPSDVIGVYGTGYEPYVWAAQTGLWAAGKYSERALDRAWRQGHGDTILIFGDPLSKFVMVRVVLFLAACSDGMSVRGWLLCAVPTATPSAVQGYATLRSGLLPRASVASPFSDSQYLFRIEMSLMGEFNRVIFQDLPELHTFQDGTLFPVVRFHLTTPKFAGDAGCCSCTWIATV